MEAMNKSYVKKPLAIAVILLLIGVALPPCINANICKASENNTPKPHNITVVDDCNSKALGDALFRKSILLTPPEIQKVGDCLKIHVEEETSQTMKPNWPLLPVVTHVFLFPFKTKIKDET